MKKKTPLEMTAAREPLARVVARNIKRRRRMLGLSRDDVSAKSGLSPDTLLRMECESEGITLIELEEVARALGVTSADLVRRGKKRSVETGKPSAGRKAR